MHSECSAQMIVADCMYTCSQIHTVQRRSAGSARHFCFSLLPEFCSHERSCRMTDLLALPLQCALLCHLTNLACGNPQPEAIGHTSNTCYSVDTSASYCNEHFLIPARATVTWLSAGVDGFGAQLQVRSTHGTVKYPNGLLPFQALPLCRYFTRHLARCSFAEGGLHFTLCFSQTSKK